MNKQIMESFYLKMQEGNNFQNALSLKSLVDNLQSFRRDRVVLTFKEHVTPFTAINPWQTSAIFDGAAWVDASLSLGINCDPESTSVYFWDRKYVVGTSSNDWAKAALEKMGILGDYMISQDDAGFNKIKNFAFPSQEDQLYNYIEDFNRTLAEVIKVHAELD